MTIHIKRVDSCAELTYCYLIRTRVFVVEQQVDPLLELDEEDASATHYLLTVDRVPVGTCRIVLHHHEAKIGRFAILKDFRGKGLGHQLLHFAEDDIAQLVPEIHRFYLGAQLTAIPFYEKAGYQPYGDIFDDAHIDHRMMEKSMKKRNS